MDLPQELEMDEMFTSSDSSTVEDEPTHESDGYVSDHDSLMEDSLSPRTVSQANNTPITQRQPSYYDRSVRQHHEASLPFFSGFTQSSQCTNLNILKSSPFEDEMFSLSSCLNTAHLTPPQTPPPSRRASLFSPPTPSETCLEFSAQLRDPAKLSLVCQYVHGDPRCPNDAAVQLHRRAVVRERISAADFSDLGGVMQRARTASLAVPSVAERNRVDSTFYRGEYTIPRYYSGKGKEPAWEFKNPGRDGSRKRSLELMEDRVQNHEHKERKLSPFVIKSTKRDSFQRDEKSRVRRDARRMTVGSALCRRSGNGEGSSFT